MRLFRVSGLIALLLLGWSVDTAHAQPAPAGGPRIDWEVKNRFRLFRSEADFQRHVAAYRGDGILAAEQRLARDSDGRGWARDIVERLCVDRAGRLTEFCERDGTREVYLSPSDHRIGVVLGGNVPANTGCSWTFDDGEGKPQQAETPCNEEVRLRVSHGRPTTASVDIALPDGTAQRIVTDITVRDLLIAGLGDSIAAGEGNPDRPVRLSNEGFCFRQFLSGGSGEYYRPGRDGYTGNRACVLAQDDPAEVSNWARQSARWKSGSCHRSLYSYQLRAALALAIENPQLAVTFVPLGCSGATIEAGFFGSQRARECPSPGTNAACPGTVRGQLAELVDALKIAQKHNPERGLDQILLTIGANDILFSGLIADVIVDFTTERVLFNRGGHMASPEDAQRILDGALPDNFAKLRAALKPLVGGNLARVVFVSYGHPALAAPNVSCPGGGDGFDIHPAFAVDANRLKRVSDFVTSQFLPKIRALAVCEGKTCRDPATDRMTFADAHQLAFASHGVCARSNDDPAFDRECFSQKGDSFRSDLAVAATDPLTCGRAASEYRPYAPRARWVRTANDSYFTAMTYPQSLPSASQPANIHDATWGVLSAVYGGAVHPTAEGHAAMADAALPRMRAALGLASRDAVRSEPLGPPLQINEPPAILPAR